MSHEFYVAAPLEEDAFVSEVAKLADKGRAFLKVIEEQELAAATEHVLWDGLDPKLANDSFLKAEEMRSKKRLHSELKSALDGFIDSQNRLKQARLRSHVRAGLEARRHQVTEPSFDELLATVFSVEA